MVTFKQFLNESTIDRNKVIQDLEKFLEGNLKPYASSFVDAGIQYNIDPYLTASISMLETGRGKASVLTKFNNVGGVWDSKTKHHKQYGNVRDSIFDQARILKNGYISQGLNTFEKIGNKYAPPGASNDPNGTNAQWPVNVSSFYRQATGSDTLLAGGAFTGEGTSSNQTRIASSEGESNTTDSNNTQQDNSSGITSALNTISSGLSDIYSAIS